jgi:hypothetical protein
MNFADWDLLLDAVRALTFLYAMLLGQSLSDQDILHAINDRTSSFVEDGNL